MSHVQERAFAVNASHITENAMKFQDVFSLKKAKELMIEVLKIL